MLQAQKITCRRGGRALFRDVACVVETGAVLRVTGSNGSGKSSLLRMKTLLLARKVARARKAE